MNIFYVHTDPQLAAQQHCDKHCTKMLAEYGQLLSTAHRVLDGQKVITKNKRGGKLTTYLFEDEVKEQTFYKSCYVGHPSNVWLRDSRANYEWLHACFVELGKEFVKRYKKDVDHMTIQKLAHITATPPVNISNKPFVGPTPAMPDYCKIEGDSLASYRKFYINEKPFAEWRYTETPAWFIEGKEELAKSALSFYDELR